MAGKLYGIGVGPGDPELLTMKAVRLIRECDRIAVPGKHWEDSAAYKIALGAVPELAHKKAEGILMPMTKDQDILQEHYQIGAARISKWLDAGEKVGFLTLGDVTVYSTFLYIHRLVKAAGYPTEMINGIPSFCAAAARLDAGLAEGAQEIHILPASYQIEQGLKLSGTKILMKAGRQINQVKKQIRKSGLNAVMIENCNMEGERIYLNADEINEKAGYYSLIIVKDSQDLQNHSTPT